MNSVNDIHIKTHSEKKSSLHILLHCCFLFLFFQIVVLSSAQSVRTEISLNENWKTIANDENRNAFSGFENASFNDSKWKQVNVPHNWDAYDGYRRKLHGNRHGYAWYRKSFTLRTQPKEKRVFLFFEGVGSYATIWLNGKKIGEHPGGRTSFTLDVTNFIKYDAKNLLAVRADHPAGIKNLPWVCGGCSDERGFSEGSQPMGIFRPVHLVISNDLRIEPFGVHIWNDTTISKKSAKVFIETEIKNYGSKARNFLVKNKLVNGNGKTETEITSQQSVNPGKILTIKQQPPEISNPNLWSLKDPYLYTLVTEIHEGNQLIDQVKTSYGIRKIRWSVIKPGSSNQFYLNDEPVFINGIAEYEHLLGNSHAFGPEQIRSRALQIKAAGFNAFRDAHHPHNLLYQNYWDSLGLLLWTQMGAHVWYDSEAFRNNFKTLLKEWVKERRNNPSVVLWGLQNESKLPESFAKECTELIRELDPTASSQRLVTTCNGGSGTDWDVPQNWTGTYGGNPATYDADMKRQVLIGEYGAWRTIDLHTEGPFVQNGSFSEDRMTQLMEIKIKLAEEAKDSTSGHFMWLFTSHDNPGRVQGGEGFRELDRIGPVNYKGLLTPWEEPLDVYYLYRSNYAPKETEPMVYIVSHTWPDRWINPGNKSGIVVFSNCDEVELFNDVNDISLGKRKKAGKGSHFQWDDVNILYNVLYAVGYVNGKAVAKDYIVLRNLPESPRFNSFYIAAADILAPQKGYHYLYRINCGGPDYRDSDGNKWLADRKRKDPETWGSASWTDQFAGMPAYFASQRSTADPISGTKDWNLFQDFRYGRENLQYHFPVKDGEYLVELYFTEPWLGTCGGMNATGFRLFDVAINHKTVIQNLDIWKESGHDGALKKTVLVKITGGMMTISFPRIAAGQALISAIAIAATDNKLKAAASPLPVFNISGSRENREIRDWLSAGDEIYMNDHERFLSLDPLVYGAQWIKAENKLQKTDLNLVFNEDADLFLGLDSSIQTKPSWLNGFEKTGRFISTTSGNAYALFKKRFKKGTRLNLATGQDKLFPVIAIPANNMEPAYDLKTAMNYKAVNAVLAGPGIKPGKIDGKDRVIFEQPSPQNQIEWKISVGVADIYSLTISYNNPNNKILKGKLQILSADGTLMKEEQVEFTPTREGKNNYISTNTGSMINAGYYLVRLTAPDAAGLNVNAVDVQ